MAYPALADEIRKRKAEESLYPADDLASAIDDSQVDTSTQDQQPLDAGKKGGYDYELIPEAAAAPPPPKLETKTDEQVVAPTPTPAAPAPATPPPLETKTDEQVVAPAPDTLAQVEKAQPVTPQPAPQVQPAPDTLDQVERAQLVKLPGGQPAPDTLPQVEKALPAHEPAPDQLAQVEKAQPATPDAVPATPPGKISQISTPPLQPTQPSTVFGMPIRGAAPAPGPAPAPAESVEAPMNAPNGQAPAALIIHHTSGNNSAESVVNDWRTNRPGVGAQMIMDRDGTIHNTQQEFGYNGTGNFLHSVIPGVNNHTAVGIEVIAKNDADMTPAQLQSLQQLAGPKGPYANVPVYGHSQVSPSDRENEGVRGVAAINAARAGGEPVAGPASGQAAASAGGYVQGRATTFGYKDKGDAGVGAPRLGTIQTNDPDLVGIAVPEEALRQQLGANPALWRQARVDVMTKDGRHMLVPIVDLGPHDTSAQRGVAADFTQGLHKMLGNTGEETYGFKIVPGAGPDVEKDPQAFIAEQRQLMTGADTRPQKTAGAASTGGHQFELVPESAVGSTPPAPQEAAKITADTQKLQDNLQQSGNLIQFYKDLDANPPQGMNKQAVASFKQSLQNTITTEMQRRFPDMTPDVAWKKAQENSSVMDLGAEGWHQLTGSFAQLAPVFAQQSPDKEQVNAFFDNAMPGASDADKQAFLAKVHALPREQQGPFIASQMPAPQAGQRGNDPMAVMTAIDHLSDPNFQAGEAKKLADARAFAEQAGTTDPRLKGTPGEALASLGGVPEQLMAYYGIPIVGAAQASEQVRARMAKEHPDWDEATLDDKSAMSALAQIAGNTVAAGLMTHGAGTLLKTVASPWRRALAQVGIGALSNAGINVGTTAATNVAEGRPAGQDLGQAALAGAIQGGVMGAAHGVGELRAGTPEVAPEVAPEVRPPPLPVKTPVTGADVTGPDVQDLTTYPWYKPPPIVTRGTERTSFTPSELAEGMAGMRAGGTPEQMQEAAAQVQPPMDFNQRGVFLDSSEAQQAEIQRAQAVQDQAVQSMQTAIENSNVGGALHKEGTVGTNGAVGEGEPWISKIANRFTSERMVNGDLGHVEPGIGVSKEQMLAAGMKMGPEQINQHVSNLMQGVGDPKMQAAAIRAEEARLSQRANDLSLASEYDSGNKQAKIDADNAFKDVTDFHNGPVAKLKNNWHAQGMTLQGEIPVDLSTYNGIREAYLRDVGKPPPPEAEPAMRQTAKRVRDASMNETSALQNLGAEIDRQSAKRNLPTADQVRENIMRRMKVEPCPV